jgi:hypothetical protein
MFLAPGETKGNAHVFVEVKIPRNESAIHPATACSIKREVMYFLKKNPLFIRTNYTLSTPSD